LGDQPRSSSSFKTGISIEHRGRIEKTTGDGLLIEFASVVDALRSATAWQAGMAEHNTLVPSDHRIEFRIGIARPVRVYRVRPDREPGISAGPALPLPDKPSIAVLPFQNMSAEPEQEYFVDGTVEEIITVFSHIRWLFVIARNLTFTYKGKAVDMRRVGRELGVRYVLEGSVCKAGSRVRITAQLIEAETGAYLWADRYDCSLEDALNFQDKVALSVAGAIEPTLQAAETALANVRRTTDLTVYDAHLRSKMGRPNHRHTASWPCATLTSGG
jgi:TolB-like protein